jgi:hypothetical protein
MFGLLLPVIRGDDEDQLIVDRELGEIFDSASSPSQPLSDINLISPARDFVTCFNPGRQCSVVLTQLSLTENPLFRVDYRLSSNITVRKPSMFLLFSKRFVKPEESLSQKIHEVDTLDVGSR